MGSQNPATFMNSIASLPKTLISKLYTNSEIAPLFIAPQTDDEDISTLLELPCGHILRGKDDDKVWTAGLRPLGRKGFLGDLSVCEAIRCSVCEARMLGNGDVGKRRGMGNKSAADEQNPEGSEKSRHEALGDSNSGVRGAEKDLMVIC